MNKIIAFLIIAFMVSCSGSFDISNDQKPDSTTFEISELGDIYANSGGKKVELSLSASSRWSAEASEKWIEVSPSGGEATESQPITITVHENSDSYSERQGVVSFKCEEIEKNINVVQLEDGAIVATESRFRVPKEESMLEVEVVANVEVSVEVLLDAKDWVVYEPTKVLDSKTYNFNILSNTTYDEREGHVAFLNSETGIGDTIKIVQSMSYGLELQQKEYHVDYKNQEICIDFKTNTEVGIKFLEGSGDWMSVVSSKALHDHGFVVDVGENGDEPRIGKIEFAILDKKDTITVFQSQRDALSVETKEVELSSRAQNFEIPVLGNTDIKVELGAEWIAMAEPSRTLNESSYSFSVEKNDGSKRSSMIIFAIEDSEIADTVFITQNEVERVISGSTNYELSQVEQTFEVEVRDIDNVEVAVIEGESWLSIDRGNDNGNLIVVDVKDNAHYEERSGKLAFTNLIDEITDTLYVTQAKRSAIVLGEDSRDFTSKSQDFTVRVQSNTEINAVISSEFPWIIKTSQRVDNSSDAEFFYTVFTFKLAKNSDDEIRVGEITFINELLGVSATMTINQYPEEKIEVKEDLFNLDDSSHEITVHVESNVDVFMKIVDGESWISGTKESDGLYTFEISANGYSPRTGMVVFENIRGDVSDNLVINQSQLDAIQIKNREYTLHSNGGVISVEVLSNVPFDVEIPEGVDWVKQESQNNGQQKAMSSDIYTFSVDVNSETTTREAIITFAGTAVSEQILIRQYGID